MDAAILLPMTADAAASISVAEITMDADAAEIFSGSLFFCAAAINLPVFPRKP